MIKIVIIEDEAPAAKRLQKMILELLPEAEISDPLVSIKSAIEWFKNNPAPDLIFADIHLSDGNSFEIFKQIKITAPIIFTTAFDQYALRAFKLNSVDYILKPVKKEELKNALDKFQSIYQSAPPLDFQKLISSLQQTTSAYKERFVIRFGEYMKTIETSEIAYFYTENRANYAVVNDGKRYPVDNHLDELETLLDPKHYFRINRQFIISYHSITEMLTYSKARVLIKLSPANHLETIVSTERSAAFKSWLAGES